MSTEVTVDVLKKLWGENRHVYGSPTHSLHHALIFAGGFSSRHRHRCKANVFYVVRGELVVRTYSSRKDREGRPQTLRAGERVTVDAGVWHRFEAVTDVDLIELYFAAQSESDIERLDEGGPDLEKDAWAPRRN